MLSFVLLASLGPTTTDTHHQAFDGVVDQLIVDVDGDLAITAGETGQSKHQPPPADH